MALITQVNVMLEPVSGQYSPVVSGKALTAGEALLAGSPCYIKSDGLVYMSITTDTMTTTRPSYLGFAPKAVASGEVVSLYMTGARFQYATGLTIGAPLFISATKGRLDSAVVLAGDAPVAVCVSATDIVVK